MKKQKVSKVQIIRYMVQLISLVLFPGLFILTYSNIKSLYIAIITGSFSIQGMIPVVLNLVTIIGITIILGRFFCGWLCAFGTFMDIIYAISTRILKIKFKIPHEIDRKLKYIKYVILVASIGLVWSFQSNFLDNKDPWDAFAQFPNVHSMVFNHTFAFILLIFIIVGAMFIERFFCRYLCPLGAVFSITSRFRIIKINKVKDKCGKCRICTNNCIMGIEMYKDDIIKSGECIDCFKCTSVCPRSNVKVKMAKETVAPIIAAGITVTALVSLNEGTNYIDKLSAPKINYVSAEKSTSTDNITSTNRNNTSSTKNANSTGSQNVLGSSGGVQKSSNITQATANLKYKDGVYTGTGTGFRPGDILQVTIKGGKISNIEVVSSNDTLSFFGRAYSQVVPEILNQQTINVDTVSGATMSSDGIIQAVQNALNKAE